MSPRQKQRFIIVGSILAGVGLATFFGLKAFNANIEYFLTPKQINEGQFTTEQRYRIGGMVKKGSVDTLENGVTRLFILTDCEYDVTVQYTGILPDLFREGQAIVANGKLNEAGLFTASQVLAKHDENYVPSEAAETMMKAQANKCDDTTEAVKY